MATSSIFHNVKIDSERKAKRFVEAIEASEKAEARAAKKDRPVPKISLVTDPQEIRDIMRIRNERKGKSQSV